MRIITVEEHAVSPLRSKALLPAETKPISADN